MFDALFKAIADARDHLRERAGFAVYLSDFFMIAAALLPIIRMIPGGEAIGAGDTAGAGGSAEQPLPLAAKPSHAELSAAAAHPLSTGDLASRLDGFLHVHQPPLAAAASGGPADAGPLIRQALATLAPLLAQLFLKAVAAAL